jgi:talin
MADHIPSLVEGVKGTLSNPENPAAQLNLINASEQFLQVCEQPSGHAFQYEPPGRGMLVSDRLQRDCTEEVACTVCPVFSAYITS